MSRLHRRSVADVFVLELLGHQLADWRQRTGRETDSACQVIDLGGGTGTFASRLADLGYAITVIDPSPDALASLQRRSDERQRAAGSGPAIRGLQGDANELLQLVGPQSADVVVCHRVLELVDDPSGALRAVAEVLRPGGVLSLLVALRRSVVLTQALAGHVATARQVWRDPDRFDLERIESLLADAGLRLLDSDGVGAISSHVAESLVESDPAVHAELLALEREVSRDPAFRALAPAVHVFAERPAR